jgi:hypothetical protein
MARAASRGEKVAESMGAADTYNDIDLAWLMRLRTVVARLGEMDLARWWNSNGQLGPQGASVLRRGLPRTHYFAQARSVCMVAAVGCAFRHHTLRPKVHGDAQGRGLTCGLRPTKGMDATPLHCRRSPALRFG